MIDPYIKIKKLANSQNEEFYPLTVGKAVLTSENIDVKNILGGNFYDKDHPAQSKVPIGTTLYDLLVRILGAQFGEGAQANIDTEVLSESNEKVPSSWLMKKLLHNLIDTESLSETHSMVPSSLLIKTLLTTILGGNLNLKFKVLSYEDYQLLVANDTVNSDTLYFTIGGPSPEPQENFWIITFDATGGTVSENFKYIVKGQPFGTLPVPTKSGFRFNGWYILSSTNILATEVQFIPVLTEDGRYISVDDSVVRKYYVTSSDVPQSNLTLYADWVDEDADLLCLEEDYNTLIVTENYENNIRVVQDEEESDEPILATEGDHTPVITEDKQYNISLQDSTEPILATEVDHTPVITEDKLYNISLLQTTEPILATEIQHDPVRTEDRLNLISLKVSEDPLLSTEIQRDLVRTEDSLNNIRVGTTVSSSTMSASNQNVMNAPSPVMMKMSASAPITESVSKTTEKPARRKRKSRKRRTE